MAQQAYLISYCPYPEANCDYVFDTKSGQHAGVNGRYFLYKAGGFWLVSSTQAAICKVAVDAKRPNVVPGTGWQYLKKNENRWAPSTKMQVEIIAAPTNVRPVKPTPTGESTPTPPPKVDVQPPPRSDFVRQTSAVLPAPEKLTLNGKRLTAEGWEVQKSMMGMGGTSYINQRTGERSTTLPDALRRFQEQEGQICSYTLQASNTEGQIEIFAPIKYAENNKRPIVQVGAYEHFDDYAPFWAESVKRLEAEILRNDKKIAENKAKEAAFPDERRHMQAEINRLDQQLEGIKARERSAQQKSDGMLSRVGKSHIKRDWQQSRVGTGFPAGEDFRSMFLERFLDFESFACDAVNCLEDLKVEDATAALVRQVMRPIYNFAVQEISRRADERRIVMEQEFGATLPPGGEDTIAKLFWYSTQQDQLYHEINRQVTTGAAEVTTMLNRLSPFIRTLHAEMLKQGAEGNIANDENSIRLDKLLGFLLQLQTVAFLSDPQCFLQPPPGEMVKFKEGFTMEILSPGTKMYGRIKEGDSVEVVMCGLYFEDAAGKYDTVKPVVPCLVRRLIATKK